MPRPPRPTSRDRERLASHEQRLIAIEREVSRMLDARDASEESRLDLAEELASIRERLGRLEGLAEQLDSRADHSATRGAVGGAASTIALVLAALIARALGLELPR